MPTFMIRFGIRLSVRVILAQDRPQKPMACPTGARLVARKDLFMHEEAAHDEKVRFVDRQYFHGGPSNRGQSAQCRSRPLKVLFPRIQARMVEPNHVTRVRVGACDIRTFVAVTVQAREGEVFKDGGASVLPRDDVVHVGGQRIDAGRKATILASAAGAPPNGLAQIRVQPGWLFSGLVLSTKRALDCMTASRFPTCR